MTAKMLMTVTPDANVDREKSAVIDGSQIGKISFSFDRTVPIQDIETGEAGEVKVGKISLFEHLLVVDGTPYRILHALSE